MADLQRADFSRFLDHDLRQMWSNRRVLFDAFARARRTKGNSSVHCSDVMSVRNESSFRGRTSTVSAVHERPDATSSPRLGAEPAGVVLDEERPGVDERFTRRMRSTDSVGTSVAPT